jgi:hypothetical protein
MVCTMEDVTLFGTPIPFRDSDGYLEPGGTRRGYYQPGVRRIPDDIYGRIVAAGLGDSSATDADGDAAQPYAEPGEARLVEEISRLAATDLLRSMPAVLRVESMPLNNPGYDLLAVTDEGPLYVEVKGTRGSLPRSFLSEGSGRSPKRTLPGICWSW